MLDGQHIISLSYLLSIYYYLLSYTHLGMFASFHLYTLYTNTKMPACCLLKIFANKKNVMNIMIVKTIIGITIFKLQTDFPRKWYLF